MNEPSFEERILDLLSEYDDASKEAHRLARQIFKDLVEAFPDLEYMTEYRDLVFELSKRPCFVTNAVKTRCGNCLSCRAAILVSPLIKIIPIRN